VEVVRNWSNVIVASSLQHCASSIVYMTATVSATWALRLYTYGSLERLCRGFSVYL